VPTAATRRLTTQAPAELVPAAPEPRIIVYDRVGITEYSTSSEHGPLTIADMKEMLGWETEKEYQARAVRDKPESKPEHWLYGDDYHCKNTDDEKVRTWRNANNRSFDDKWSEALEQTLLNGQWAGPLTIPGETVNGETIRISRYGSVLSGQHQMTAAIRANERLQKARTNPATIDKYPFWNGHAEVVLESIVITGLSEDPHVLMTIDYVKPRTSADVFFTSAVFREKTQSERKEYCRMLAVAVDLLWDRTDAQGYKTHPEIVGFVERHKKLLGCVDHLAKVNGTGRRISKLYLSAGQCAALCYLMSTSSPDTDGDVYRNGFPPSESVVGADNQPAIDWWYRDKATEFWEKLAGDRWFLPVRMALERIVKSAADNENNQGLGGTLQEKLAILARAWEIFRNHANNAGPPFTHDDLTEEGALSLSYIDLDDKGNRLPDDQIKLLDVADFYGIDCPDSKIKPIGRDTERAKRPTRHDDSKSEPMPAPPTKEEIEQLSQEALERRVAGQYIVNAAHKKAKK